MLVAFVGSARYNTVQYILVYVDKGLLRETNKHELDYNCNRSNRCNRSKHKLDIYVLIDCCYWWLVLTWRVSNMACRPPIIMIGIQGE